MTNPLAALWSGPTYIMDKKKQFSKQKFFYVRLKNTEEWIQISLISEIFHLSVKRYEIRSLFTSKINWYHGYFRLKLSKKYILKKFLSVCKKKKTKKGIYLDI